MLRRLCAAAQTTMHICKRYPTDMRVGQASGRGVHGSGSRLEEAKETIWRFGAMNGAAFVSLQSPRKNNIRSISANLDFERRS